MEVILILALIAIGAIIANMKRKQHFVRVAPTSPASATFIVHDPFATFDFGVTPYEDTGDPDDKHTMGENDHTDRAETTGRFNAATPGTGITSTSGDKNTTQRARRSPFRLRGPLVGATA